jgi:hypothetical protein
VYRDNSICVRVVSRWSFVYSGTRMHTYGGYVNHHFGDYSFLLHEYSYFLFFGNLNGNYLFNYGSHLDVKSIFDSSINDRPINTSTLAKPPTLKT